jgi:methionine synthase II (cobalamin-independent)
MIAPFSTTGIGSLPHTDPEEACRLVMASFDIPFWPQLPGRSYHELMIPQYSEGMPFIRKDKQKRSIWIQKDDSDALTSFYETYTEDTRIAVSEEYAKGFSVFLNHLDGKSLFSVKGHVTGPLTFTLGLKDSAGRPVYFDEELREISLMVLKAKARWQIDLLKPFSRNIIIFIDEPILSALGSSGYLGVSTEEALRLLTEISAAVKNAGGIPGIHCCGNADWPMVINSGVSIINFDAHGYTGTLAVYPSEFTGFLRSGGYLAWGIIPTNESIREESPETIRKRFDSGMEQLSRSMPGDLLLSQIILTPSCGMGSRSPEETEKVLKLLRGLKESLT